MAMSPNRMIVLYINVHLSSISKDTKYFTSQPVKFAASGPDPETSEISLSIDLIGLCSPSCPDSNDFICHADETTPVVAYASSQERTAYTSSVKQKKCCF